MKDISQFPVRQNQCSTCPFLQERMKSAKYRDPELVSRLQVQVLTTASHICHHESLEGEEATHLCRGARDYQNEILSRLELIKSTGSR